jgi:proline iminopeptidase
MKCAIPMTFEKSIVEASGYNVVTYSFGSGNEVVLCLNGGPGLPCNYLRESHRFLSDHGFRVVFFDQLGTGESDKPSDPGLWNISRYCQEVQSVVDALDLRSFHLLGHSWGGWLALEYMANADANANVRSLMLCNTCADMPFLRSELQKLRDCLGPDIDAMMKRYESKGVYAHPEYDAAVTLLNYRHICRLENWPPAMCESIRGQNSVIYNLMQGPNEYHYIGNLSDWSRLGTLQGITVPTLITVGKFDAIPIGCSMQMHSLIKGSELHLFENSSHQPFFEEPDSFENVLVKFLNGVLGEK